MKPRVDAALSCAACDCCLSAALCLCCFANWRGFRALIVLMSNFLSKLHLLAAGIFMAAFVSRSNESIYLSLFAASSRFAVEINQHRDTPRRKIVSIYPLAPQLKCFAGARKKAKHFFSAPRANTAAEIDQLLKRAHALTCKRSRISKYKL
jgi:DNA-binding helix-hairpin-helix protein with protein kinase domain